MSNTISFAEKVKEELCSNEYESKDRLMALLSAYIRINGTLIFRNKKELLLLKSENAKISRFIYEKLNELFSADAHISFANKGNIKNKTVYLTTIEDKTDEIINALSISYLEGKIPKEIVNNDDTISGYLAGAFLACGSINSPENSNYHLEFAVNNENYAKWLSKLFGKYKNSNIEPKITTRRDKFVIYFKKSEQIANFLILSGAVVSCMDFENIRVNRDFTNYSNRLDNMDMANMKKTIETANRQIEEIKLIDAKLGIDNMSNTKAKLLAKLRLENEQSSMQELADLFSEEYKENVTKSNINHLFRYLHSLFERLNREK